MQNGPKNGLLSEAVTAFALRVQLLRRHLLRSQTESPIAPAKVRQRLAEIVRRELRPHLFHEQQLGVRAFPQQEVAQPLLASGPDQQIDLARRQPVVIDARE